MFKAGNLLVSLFLLPFVLFFKLQSLDDLQISFLKKRGMREKFNESI